MSHYSGRQIARIDRLPLSGGGELAPVEIAYETWGDLTPERDNAILVLHALSGDSHVTADPADDRSPEGWWGEFVGPGLAIDTDRYFVICSNVIGGCSGSTGPSSENPATGEPYALDFPMVTIEDMVDAQLALVQTLGISKLLSVVGGSLGGMQALSWAARYPGQVGTCLAVATTWGISAQSIGFNEVGRRAILADPQFAEGRYTAASNPADGLAIARMIGHITYLSDESMSRKFGRRLRGNERLYGFGTDFEVESYLKYQGSKFVDRFDANSYLYLTKAMDYFSLATDREGLTEVFDSTSVRFLLLSFSSDWLFPTYQTRDLADALSAAGAEVTFSEIDSGYGHDAFLLEVEEQRTYVEPFLQRAFREGKGRAS